MDNRMLYAIALIIMGFIMLSLLKIFILGAVLLLIGLILYRMTKRVY